MKKHTKIILFLLVTTMISCSTKKDKWLNRTYNSVTTKYNILYNGNQAFQDGLNEINQKHKDIVFGYIKHEQVSLPMDNQYYQTKKQLHLLKILYLKLEHHMHKDML